MTDLKTHSCLNPSCRYHRQEGEGNIAVRTIFGKHEDIFLLYCRECGQNFSENRETIFSRLKTPRNKVVQVINCFSEGEGVRATSRITGLHRDTVARIFRLAKDTNGSQAQVAVTETR
jgi:hypothetical protein